MDKPTADEIRETIDTNLPKWEITPKEAEPIVGDFVYDVLVSLDEEAWKECPIDTLSGAVDYTIHHSLHIIHQQQQELMAFLHTGDDLPPSC